MRIAVIAWGSLVWDRRELMIANDFKPNGPQLPIEFCRISSDGRLTLVIDETFGTACSSYAAISTFGDLNDAIENLRIREGMPGTKSVGFVDLASGKHSYRAMERHAHAVAAIRAWAIANDHDAAIWTALANNFHEPQKAAEGFSVSAAIRYLETLKAPQAEEALKYIRQAPSVVQTPVRAAVKLRWPLG